MPLQPKFMQKAGKGRTLWLPQISDYQHSTCDQGDNFSCIAHRLTAETDRVIKKLPCPCEFCAAASAGCFWAHLPNHDAKAHGARAKSKPISSTRERHVKRPKTK